MRAAAMCGGKAFPATFDTTRRSSWMRQSTPPSQESAMDKPIPTTVRAQAAAWFAEYDKHNHFPAMLAEDAYAAGYAAAQQQGQAVALDRMAIKLLVAAGFVTEDKANEALRIAHGFDKGPLAPPSAPVGVKVLARDVH